MKNVFSIINLFSPSEFDFLKTLITSHVNKRVNLLDISKYHQIATDEIHLRLSSKKERVLSEIDSNKILALSAIKNLLKDNPCYHIHAVVYDSKSHENRPQFYFRLVRPNKLSDIGFPHCDFWFDEATHTKIGRGNSVKFWIPIVMEPGKNGLLFYPCLTKDVPYLIANEDGFRRPKINCEISSLGDPILPQPNYGQAIKFCDDVMHCGAPNIGSTTRVSMEITLVKTK